VWLVHADAATPTAAPHPVADVLRERAERGSMPGARDDPHRVALVLEGGGMRGVVSAAMAAVLERLGLTASFDLVVGSSAGAINGASLLAGVAEPCAATYCGPFASRSFVNPARIILGRPVIVVNYVLAYESETMDLGRHERALASPIALHCVAVDVDTAAAVDLTGMRSKRELCEAILASSRMPLAGGAPVEVGARRFIDGALASPIPVAEALAAGATHVLALQTRPHGVPRRSASRLGDVFIERHLRRLNPALVTLYRERIVSYEATVDDLARRSLDLDGGPPHVLGLRLAATTPVVGQLERRAAVLTAAAADAERLVAQTPGLVPDGGPTSRAARRA
jgi:predicted patatin/cPLA2 family phospholipase